MTRSRLSILAGLGLAALLGGALTACATPIGNGDTPPPPPGADASSESVEIDLDAAWLDDGRMVGVVTLGSSTCVPFADEPTLDGDVLEVTFVDVEGDTPCTRDLVPRVTFVAVPDDADVAAGLTVNVTGDGYHGTVELPGLTDVVGVGPGEAPSAGWTQVEGQFVILTWGSSSCLPLVQDTQATGEAEVTVTFALPADMVCTMDFVPRANIAFVDGLEQHDGAVAILTGGVEFPDVGVPILGTN